MLGELGVLGDQLVDYAFGVFDVDAGCSSAQAVEQQLQGLFSWVRRAGTNILIEQ